MTTQVRELMTTDPIVLDGSRTITDAASVMREADVGAVLVQRDGVLHGLLTDRDIVTRVVVEGLDPGEVTVAEACSDDLHTVTGDADLGDTVRLMRRHAVRRIPVVDGDRPVGIVSLGDLAVARDPDSALADISAAEPNA